jgi:tRNA(Ile)-lysidine synthase
VTPIDPLRNAAADPTAHTPPAPIATVLESLQSAQANYHLFPSPDHGPTPVVVGVSGGADSVCLLHALATLAPAWGLALHVAHVDHALRPSSADDADFVAELSIGLGLPCHSTRLAPGSLRNHPDGLEAGARTARYAFLAQVALAAAPRGGSTLAGAAQPAVVAVAHHRDDQAETVLLRLIQGSGLGGLAGMAWSSVVPGAPEIRLVRPLLALPRTALHSYLMATGLPWREDASNRRTDRTRNAIRHDILPRLARLNPNIAAVLAATADRLAAEAERAAQLDAAALEALLVDGDTPATYLALDLDRLLAADLATRRGVVRLALQRLGADMRDAGHAAVQRILARIATNPLSGGPYPLQEDIAWTVVGAAADRPALLSLHRRDAPPLTPSQPLILPDVPLPIPIPESGFVSLPGVWELYSVILPIEELPADWRERGHPWRVFLDADAAAELALTVPAIGRRIAPLGMAGHTRSLGDLFTDHKVPAAHRRAWPIVIDAQSGDVLWVCGLLVSEAAAVRPETQRVRSLTWQELGARQP